MTIVTIHRHPVWEFGMDAFGSTTAVTCCTTSLFVIASVSDKISYRVLFIIVFVFLITLCLLFFKCHNTRDFTTIELKEST